VEEIGRRREIETAFTSEGDLSGLDDDVQLVVYRVAQEALSNAARHSEAGSITVSLRRHDRQVELEVTDDGRGFSFAASEGGLGITGMRERALLVDGEVEIHSRPGEGTTVWLRIDAPQDST
jgi:two-component system, NarL family, sensor histidine kinase UhpB